MTDTLTLSVEDAQDIVDGDHVAIQELDRHRWYTRRLVVYKGDAGWLEGFIYLDPVSEIQEDQDRFESDPVTVFPVRAKSVTTTVYERAEVDLSAAVEALKKLGIEADAPDQSGNAPGFQQRLVLNIRGICIDEFSDWVSIELRHLDPNSEWFERKPTAAEVAEHREILDADPGDPR